MDAETVRQALKKALLELNPRDSWPVNLHGLLSRLGIRLLLESTTSRGESYLELSQPPVILVQRENPGLFLSSRERFSIAHELAHWVVWRRFGAVPSSQAEYWFHENLCNEFAAGLLVPQPALNNFLKKLNDQGIEPVSFPSRVAQCGAVSWEVAAKSIALNPLRDSAYLRLEIFPPRSSTYGRNPATAFKVNCSTVLNSSGSFIGKAAIIRDELDFIAWMNELRPREVKSRAVTLLLGALRLTNVHCTFLRESDFWHVHFRPSFGGIEIQNSRVATEAC